MLRRIDVRFTELSDNKIADALCFKTDGYNSLQCFPVVQVLKLLKEYQGISCVALEHFVSEFYAT